MLCVRESCSSRAMRSRSCIAPAPAQAKMTPTGMALIHGYTTAFWVAAAIFGAGAVICGTLFRRGRIPDA